MVICVFNEEDNIAPLANRIVEALSGYDFEAIFVDDGSTDRTKEKIRAIADNRFLLVELRKNFGQSSALQ
ncbi:MAG TPA: glycosyltransferase, partial [Prolixibacteraceae bacterium]|nr:glycosyltransferase [Prolixibacteraceae bacterium]